MTRRSWGARLLALAWTAGGFAAAAADPAIVNPANRIDPADAAWRELTATVAGRTSVTAEFEERRHFPFRKEPVVLSGTVRILAEAGLSLHYTAPEERIVIVDREGLLIRDPAGQQSPPADPRASAANQALLHVLRMDLGALAPAHEVHGRIQGRDWIVVLVPRDVGIRRAIGDIFVEGETDAVRRIELRRSAKQFVEIRIGPARDVTFSAEERRRFFR